MIELKNISYKIRDKVILENVSVRVQPNEILAVLGPNGAGKSTLLNITSGLIKAQKGAVILNSQNIGEYNTKNLAKLRSVVSQKSSLNTPFSVLDVVLMGRLPFSNSSKENYEIAVKALTATNSLKFIDRIYTNLSGGEQQRVQFARALAQIAFQTNTESRFLLLDEPTANLDIGQTYSLMKTCKEVTNQNLGVFWVVHEINLALNFADKFLFLKEGKVLAYGNQSIINESLIEEVFHLPMKTISNGEKLNFLPQL